MKRALVALAGAGAVLCGCATPYQEMGLLGGVEAYRVSDDTLQVVAKGNGFTDPATIQRYALRKAAEVTLASGYDYFALTNENDTTRHGTFSTATANYSRGSAWAFGSSWETLKPGQQILVRMLKGPAPTPLPPNVYDAHQAAAYLAGGGYIPAAPSR